MEGQALVLEVTAARACDDALVLSPQLRVIAALEQTVIPALVFRPDGSAHPCKAQIDAQRTRLDDPARARLVDLCLQATTTFDVPLGSRVFLPASIAAKIQAVAV